MGEIDDNVQRQSATVTENVAGAPQTQQESHMAANMTAPSEADKRKLHDVQITTDSPNGDTEKHVETLGKLYDAAIADPERQKIFRARMDAIAKSDPQTFADMTKIGDDIAGGAKPDQVGAEIADAMLRTAQRAAGNGPADMTSNQIMTVMGAYSGLMLAERISGQDTINMVNAAEDKLQASPNRFGVAHENGAQMELHAVRWGDNGEPALSAYTPGQNVDRLNFGMQHGQLKQGGAVETKGKK